MVTSDYDDSTCEIKGFCQDCKYWCELPWHVFVCAIIRSFDGNLLWRNPFDYCSNFKPKEEK